MLDERLVCLFVFVAVFVGLAGVPGARLADGNA